MAILLYNAEVFGNPDGEWILIRGEKIEKVGKGNLPSASKKINLKGATLFPGFCDSHTHLSNIAIMHDYLDLSGKSRAQVLKEVERECKRKKIILGRGWDESLWENKEYLRCEELDSLCPNKPVILIREDGHMGVINTAAEKKFGVKSDEGVVKEKVLENLLKKLKIGRKINLEFAQEYALRKGVTCVHDFSSPDVFREIECHQQQARQ